MFYADYGAETHEVAKVMKLAGRLPSEPIIANDLDRPVVEFRPKGSRSRLLYDSGGPSRSSRLMIQARLGLPIGPSVVVTPIVSRYTLGLEKMCPSASFLARRIVRPTTSLIYSIAVREQSTAR
jgi:hypothetical protein